MKLKTRQFREKNRFDLEEAIMAVWSTQEDLQIVFEKFYDKHESMAADDMANLLLGLKALHAARCERLWDIFEILVDKGVIGYEPRNETPFGKANETYEGSN